MRSIAENSRTPWQAWSFVELHVLKEFVAIDSSLAERYNIVSNLIHWQKLWEEAGNEERAKDLFLFQVWAHADAQRTSLRFSWEHSLRGMLPAFICFRPDE